MKRSRSEGSINGGSTEAIEWLKRYRNSKFDEDSNLCIDKGESRPSESSVRAPTLPLLRVRRVSSNLPKGGSSQSGSALSFNKSKREESQSQSQSQEKKGDCVICTWENEKNGTNEVPCNRNPGPDYSLKTLIANYNKVRARLRPEEEKKYEEEEDDKYLEIEKVDPYKLTDIAASVLEMRNNKSHARTTSYCTGCEKVTGIKHALAHSARKRREDSGFKFIYCYKCEGPCVAGHSMWD